MLSLQELRSELARVTYKPAWRFFLYEHGHGEGVWLSIRAELPDARRRGKTTVVNIRTGVPPIPTTEYFHAWLMYRLGRIESHELREFYRVDGVRLCDPHAPGSNE